MVEDNFKVISFTFKCCAKLALNDVTLATSCHLYHRFFKEYSYDDYDQYTIASTAIYLATKVEEKHTRLRDIVNVCYQTRHPDKPVLELNSHFWNLRDTIASCELLLLRVLKFDVVYDHPHKYLLHYLMSLSKLFRKKTWERSGVADTSWAFLKDSYLSSAYLKYPPKLHAISVIDLAIKCCKLNIPNYAAHWHISVCTDNEFTENDIKNVQIDLVKIFDNDNNNDIDTIS